MIGNMLDFQEGMHVVMPRLVAQHGGIFTASFPSNSKYAFDAFEGPTVILSDPKLLEELWAMILNVRNRTNIHHFDACVITQSRHKASTTKLN